MRNNLMEKGELKQWQYTKKYGWNVQIDGVQYLVEYMKGSIFINGGEGFQAQITGENRHLKKEKIS